MEVQYFTLDASKGRDTNTNILMSLPLVKRPIVFLYDQSFIDIRGIYIVLDVISSTMDKCRDDTFVYDSYYRIKEHTESFGKVFRIPQERLIEFSHDDNSSVKQNEYANLLLSYEPKKIFVFRDHANGKTATMINKFVAAGLDVVEINSEYNVRKVCKRSGKRNKYYKRGNGNENY